MGIEIIKPTKSANADFNEENASNPSFIKNKPDTLADFTDDIGATASRLPLSVFLNPGSGNDETAVLESASNPFRTFEALVDALPNNDTTYTIYILGGGVVNLTRQLPLRNFNFVAFNTTIINFTNIPGNNVFEYTNNSPTYNFEGQNISLLCEGNKEFRAVSGTSRYVSFTGTINVFNCNGSFYTTPNTNLTINQVSDEFGGNFRSSDDNSYIRIKDLRLENNTNIFSGFGNTYDNVAVIDNVTQLNAVDDLSIGGASWKLEIGNVDHSGIVSINSQEVKFFGTIDASTNIRVTLARIVKGNVETTNPIDVGYMSVPLLFEDFKGKVGNFLPMTGQPITFKNCDLTIDAFLISQTRSTTYQLRFKGFNTINVGNGSGLLCNYPTGTINIINTGTVKGNFTAYAQSATVTNTFATFKEKLNEKVIRSKWDVINKTLDVNTTYIIDGDIELNTGEYIRVPSGGNLTINGYGLEASSITKNVAGESIFTSPVGGSGGLQLDALKFNLGTATTSVFALEDETGFNAVECTKVNFEGSGVLGYLDGYRQALWSNIGIFGLADGIEFRNNWLGGFTADKVIVRNVTTATGILFKAGTGLVFNSRFFLNSNCVFPTGWELADFATGNFASDNLFQIKDGQYVLNGSSDAAINTILLIPNITEKDSKTLWEKNLGISNSYAPFTRIKGEDGLYYELYIDGSGTLTTRTI